MRVEDILPLSPLQEGLLFHALYDDQAADVYITQLVFALEGALDEATLQATVGIGQKRQGAREKDPSSRGLAR